MDEDENIVKKYILAAMESEMVDFKEKFPASFNNPDFVKDILSFVNCAALGDKFLIFGVSDKERAVVGVESDKIPDISTLENIVSEKIEPRVIISCGTLNFDGKTVFYIKIPKENNNPPYMIREELNNLKQGEIFIRVGTCNRNANRADIDAMYKRNSQPAIKLYSDFVRISQVNMPKEIIKKPIYGLVEVELINPTEQPILICDGYITIHNDRCSKDRQIMRIDPTQDLIENTYRLTANSREMKTMLFEFKSEDFIELGFDDAGILSIDTEIQVVLFDTDEQEYKTEIKPALLKIDNEVIAQIKKYLKVR